MVLQRPDGSSPLTRGKLEHMQTVRKRHGLIPAHAGKTRSRRPFAAWRWAHPRSRGENRSPNPNPTTATGSSPLTRGKQWSEPQEPQPQGLIPAHAGKTLSSSPLGVKVRAHPRSRGENFSHRDMVICDVGSSPLTRGKLEAKRIDGAPGGLIPAHAGKTMSALASSMQSRAHPRSRGENVMMSCAV